MVPKPWFDTNKVKISENKPLFTMKEQDVQALPSKVVFTFKPWRQSQGKEGQDIRVWQLGQERRAPARTSFQVRLAQQWSYAFFNAPIKLGDGGSSEALS